MTVTMEVYFRTVWFDWRLAFNNTPEGSCFHTNDGGWTPFPESDLEHIWKPNVYIENLLDGTEKVSQSMFYLSPEGRVWYWRKSAWTISCAMTFKDLPRDVQCCFIRLSSSFGAPHVQLNTGLPSTSNWVSNGIVYDPCLDTGGSAGWAVGGVAGNRTGDGAGGSLLTDLHFSLVRPRALPSSSHRALHSVRRDLCVPSVRSAAEPRVLSNSRDDLAVPNRVHGVRNVIHLARSRSRADRHNRHAVPHALQHPALRGGDNPKGLGVSVAPHLHAGNCLAAVCA